MNSEKSVMQTTVSAESKMKAVGKNFESLDSEMVCFLG